MISNLVILIEIDLGFSGLDRYSKQMLYESESREVKVNLVTPEGSVMNCMNDRFCPVEMVNWQDCRIEAVGALFARVPSWNGW